MAHKGFVRWVIRRKCSICGKHRAYVVSVLEDPGLVSVTSHVCMHCYRQHASSVAYLQRVCGRLRVTVSAA